MNKKTFILLLVLVALTSTLLNDCTKYKMKPNICFQQDVLPIFISKCSTSGCHNGDSTRRRRLTNLTTYEGIMSRVNPNHPLLSDAYKKISGINPSMPPAGYPKLTTAEREIIKYWIHTGAKNSTDCGTSNCDTVNVSYSKTIKPLMDTWCVGCHSSSSAGGGYDFSSYDGVKAAITPRNRLSGSIHHLAGYTAMPQNGSMLDICNLRAIDNWISASYPNN